jgi:hypothetical protein
VEKNHKQPQHYLQARQHYLQEVQHYLQERQLVRVDIKPIIKVLFFFLIEFSLYQYWIIITELS